MFQIIHGDLENKNWSFTTPRRWGLNCNTNCALRCVVFSGIFSGDALGIYPKNNPSEVTDILMKSGLSGGELVTTDNLRCPGS